MGDILDEVLQDLTVEKVEPAPDESRLLVIFTVRGVAAGMDKADVMLRLEGVRPLLMNEVAQAIRRRKVPELAFEMIREMT